jgi:simple sugar transport system permease protein
MKFFDSFRIRFEKREKIHPLSHFLILMASLLISLVICAVMLLALGFNPLNAYFRMVRGSFGSVSRISESLLQAIPLMFCALGVSVSFKMSLNNIGAEGQFMWGAFAATFVALYCPWIPEHLVIPAMFAAGFLAGGLWAVLAVAPRAFWGVNETLITLMFNYIALLWVDYWLYGPWRDTTTSATNLPYSEPFPSRAVLTAIGDTRLNNALFIALIAALVILLFFKITVRGYQIRVIGASQKAARYAGMNIAANVLFVMLVSGGLAGMAGVAQVAGPIGRLQPAISNGNGYTAIVIAYLSKFNPLMVVLVSVIFGGMSQGGFSIQIAKIPPQIVTVIQGLILFCVLGGEIFSRNRLVFTRVNASDTKETQK